jgi:RNA polymerase sigma factor, sigma-70 family
MRTCAGELPKTTREPSTCWSDAIRSVPIASRGQVVRDREEAKDCSQEAFIRLHESAGSFAGQSKFSTWFYRILVNCCLDQARKRKGWRKLIGWGSQEEERGSLAPVERVAAPFVDPTDAMVTDSRMSQLWEAVEKLSPQQRAAVMLQCREELSTKEIAAVLICRRPRCACTCTARIRRSSAR